MGDALLVADLGVVPYGTALKLQRDVARRRIAGEIADDVLLLVEHPHVITLGRASKDAHLVASRESLAARGVELFDVERGGDVTYHGPGQLVGYPIIDLKQHRKDLHWYLRQVEEALIETLSDFRLTGIRVPGYTGVWVESASSRGETPANTTAQNSGDSTLLGATAVRIQDGKAYRRKIASIGVHARDWVTWHGFALNVTTDLTYFEAMVPCGIPGVTMTSISRELNDNVQLTAVKHVIAEAFGHVFNLTPVSSELGTTV